ncbi:MAG: hypothetical protein LQ343_002729 [Gyalolechia ehrenbergii]|nr:MAG: hypothetical protein LQ343_002729 [Gyalolechia ehrenbergii]
MPPSNPPTISNPLRILVLTTSPSTPLPQLIEGSELPLETPYYSTTLPIWHDTISNLQEWRTEWLAPEAGEVIQSIGAWVVVIRKPSSAQGEGEGETIETIRSTLSTIHGVLSHHREISNGYTAVDNDPLLSVVGMPQPLRPLLNMKNEEWEDLSLDCGGWEWIDSEAKGKNEFGENVGFERLKETLEANEWDGGDVDAENNINVFETELGLRDGSFASEGIEVETDAPGMHEAILDHQEDGGIENHGGNIQVEELESMMLKMQAIKEKGAGMADDERKHFAAKAVAEVMKSVESTD